MSDDLIAADATPASTPAAPVASGLKGRVGVIELVLIVLAFSAPIVVVSGFIPFVITFGGTGAPMAFVVAMVLLLLFAVGYTTMSRYLENPGAFYAYITAGLGRVLGLGASFLAITGYFLMAVGTYMFFGIATSSLVATTLGGPATPWYWYSFACVALTGILGYLRIDLSAKVLSVAMICEVLIVAIFDAAVLGNGGPEGRSLTPFTWDAFTSGSIGVAVLFAATMFLGFEATAIFREETKDPRRTVSRATYLAVASIGIFYIITVWLIIVAYGTGQATDAASSDPAGMFPGAVQRFVGVWAQDVVTVLVVTSAFAAVLSVQNILARYCYSLGVDRVLPSVLGKVHARHGSPYVSSLTITTLLVVALLALLGGKPATMYSWLTGTGGFCVLVLMFLTGLAVVVFFRRRTDIRDSTRWHTLIAPILGTTGMGVVLYLAITHFTTMTGGSGTVATILQLIVWGVFLTGLVLALIYRAKKPDAYTRIGRQKVD